MQSTPASENKKKDELDEESLDPNVRGNSFRVFVFKSVISLESFFFLLLTSVHMIFLFDLTTRPKELRIASVDIITSNLVRHYL